MKGHEPWQAEDRAGLKDEARTQQGAEEVWEEAAGSAREVSADVPTVEKRSPMTGVLPVLKSGVPTAGLP